MSFNLEEGSYIFRGDAFGVSARFEHPEKDFVPTQAQAILAPTGGEAVSVVRDYNYKDRVMFKEAIARVVGSQHDETYFTDVTCTIRDLRFMQVHADYINMHIASEHRRRETKKGYILEGDVTMATSKINELFVAGHKIGIRWDEELSKYPTYEALRKALPKRGRSYGCGNSPDHVLYDTIATIEDGVEPLSKSEAKILLNDRDAKLPGLRFYRNVVLVPDFGKIFIGEVLIERGIRRVNMLRIELGCGTDGGGSAGGGTGNGTDIPPQYP